MEKGKRKKCIAIKCVRCTELLIFFFKMKNISFGTSGGKECSPQLLRF